MRFRDLTLLTLCVGMCCGTGVARAQVTATAASAKRDSFPQASLPVSPSIVNARRDATANLQIRVTVQYLMVDSETRAAIFKDLNRETIVSSVQTPPAPDPINLDETVSPVTSLQQFHSPSRVTTYRLSESEFAEAVKKAVDSPHSQVNVAPKIILLNDNEVEMTDLVQRPFVIGFHLEGDTVRPDLHVLDEGTRLRLVAHMIDKEAGKNSDIELKCELSVQRLLDVKTDEVFGIKDEPLMVQVPIQQVTSAVTSRALSAGQALLIDPHVSETHSVHSETKIPMLGKLPYVGRTFKNVSVGSIEQHMILLLQPSIEPMAK